MKKILIIGSKGMAGHVMQRYFSTIDGFEVYAVARNISENDTSFNIDVSDTERLQTLIKIHEFDVVVNCIGILNKDAEDHPSKAVWFNSYFPHFLEEITKNTQTKVIHISTDCVFSGKRGNYTEADVKDGIGFYAQSKALGEIDNAKDVTIRTSIIGPEINPNGIGLLHWFLSQPLEAKLNGYSNAYWTGLTTLELAKVVHEVIHQNISGIIQVVPSEKINKYELLQLFNSVFRNNQLEIADYDAYKVDKSLLFTRKDFNYHVPTYEQMLVDLKTWILDHNTLYKHYSL